MTPGRTDLLALTPESLAALANAGLVKRAQKELEQSKGPGLVEEPDGTVVGIFADGVTARLPPGVPLRDAPCTCGAVTVCRHRIAVVLAYRAQHGGEPAPAEAKAAPPWSPGEIDDAALLARLGRRTLERARSLRRSCCTVEVRRPGPLDPVPTAGLPTCTVRFLVPRDLAYARCDCLARQDCEHVAVAVWAFRAADERDRSAPQLLVQVAEEAGKQATADPVLEALEAAVHLGEEILLEGVVHSRESLAQAFALGREGLLRTGLTWPLTLLEELEDTLAAYRARSARYRAGRVAGLLAELAARKRAARGGGELPVPFVLGQGEALETRLDHLRLVSLGARVEADGRDREAEILLADPDTAMVLVLRKRWSFPETEEPPDATGLAARRMASGTALGALARGQIVTRVARRRANRSLFLGEARGGLTSVTPQEGAWDILPAPLRVTRIADLAAAWKARPPQLLRPRILAENVHVFAVEGVAGLFYAPGEQTLFATLLDAEGEPFHLARPYRAVAPHALDHLAAALTGTWGPVRFVSGEVRRHLGSFVVDPLAVVCDRLIILDLESKRTARPPLPHARPSTDPPVEAAAAEALGLLEEGAHQGLRRAAPGYPDRLRASAEKLEKAGLTTSAARLRHLETSLRLARTATTEQQEEGWGRVSAAWADAAIHLDLVREVG